MRDDALTWYDCEAWGIDKPKSKDAKMSKRYNYYRKDIVSAKIEVPTMGDKPELKDGWKWKQCKVPKDLCGIFESENQNTIDIADLTDAIIELANILGGE